MKSSFQKFVSRVSRKGMDGLDDTVIRAHTVTLCIYSKAPKFLHFMSSSFKVLCFRVTRSLFFSAMVHRLKRGET